MSTRIGWKLVVVLTLFAAGLLSGRAWFPRVLTVPVDREVLKVVDKLIPGVAREIVKYVPGPERRVEVPIVVERPGPERVVTITKPVETTKEVVRERWPQSITVRVGSVLTDRDEWAVPKFQDLVIGQVSPGVYAAPAQQGWRVESVRTETRINPDPDPRGRWHVEVRPTLGVVGLGPTLAITAGAQFVASKDHTVVTIAGGKSTAGDWIMLFWSYRF